MTFIKMYAMNHVQLSLFLIVNYSKQGDTTDHLSQTLRQSMSHFYICYTRRYVYASFELWLKILWLTFQRIGIHVETALCEKKVPPRNAKNSNALIFPASMSEDSMLYNFTQRPNNSIMAFYICNQAFLYEHGNDLVIWVTTPIKETSKSTPQILPMI